MIGQLLLGLLADVVFRWASVTGRSFQTEVRAYLDGERALAEEVAKKTVSR